MAATGLGVPLYTVDQIPHQFHERFIVHGYRHPNSSPKQCVLSLFGATNETLNFWTHFIGTWYFMWIIRTLHDIYDFRHDSYTWPLLACLCMCCVTTLASSIAHAFNSISAKTMHICFFVDYFSLSMLCLGSSISIRAYVFPSDLRETWYGKNYICLSFVASLCCTIGSCQTRFMQPSGLRQVLRLGAFALPYFSTSVPVIYRLVLGTAQEMALPSWNGHALHFILLSLASFVYATHLPERLWPGNFDIVGQSHQIFHILTVLAGRESIIATRMDLEDRKASLLQNWEFDRSLSTIGVLSLLLVLNILILVGYSCKLDSFIKGSKND